MSRCLGHPPRPLEPQPLKGALESASLRSPVVLHPHTREPLVCPMVQLHKRPCPEACKDPCSCRIVSQLPPSCKRKKLTLSPSFAYKYFHPDGLSKRAVFKELPLSFCRIPSADCLGRSRVWVSWDLMPLCVCSLTVFQCWFWRRSTRSAYCRVLFSSKTN